MKTLSELFACWPTIPQMAADIHESQHVVKKWRQRQSIPVSAWPAVIGALKRKGKDVGAAELLTMHTGSKDSPISKPNNGSDVA